MAFSLERRVSRTYRFHGPGKDAHEAGPFLLRKRKPLRARAFHYVAADEFSITDAAGTRPIECYRELSSARATLTLTRVESDLIAMANPGVRPPAVLEDLHPWLPYRAYVPNSVIGYQSLKSVLARFGPRLFSNAAYCDEMWNRICNSLRRKTVWDERFHLAWHAPIQDVFLLEERRPDRTVVALDVNAMYSTCMQQGIPHPAAIRHIECGRDYRAGEQLSAGLYRCRLSGTKTAFIRRHNPFTAFFCGRRLGAPLSDEIEVDLNEFEVSYFERHFSRIYLVDGVVADKVVPHPLAREARRLFACRRNYRTQDNKPLADREKVRATLLSSCAGRPGRSSQTFPAYTDAKAYLAERYGISPPADEPAAATEEWVRRAKRLALSSTDEGVEVVGPKLGDPSTCHMLGQRTVAQGRVRLLQLMESVLALDPDVEICYVNIDSVHISVPSTRSQAVLTCLNEIASDEMGAIKIEAVTRHGLWLEPGRYWLYSVDGVERFRNRSFGDGHQPFRDRSVYVTTRQVGEMHIPIRATIRMDKSMSHLRTLHEDIDGVVRQRLVERRSDGSFSEILELLESSRASATARRLEAFRSLQLLMTSPVPLPQNRAETHR